MIQSSRDQSFDYDELDRLTDALGAYGDLDYSYDAIGNRLSLTEDGVSESYSYAPDSHRLEEILGTTTDARQYDAAGNTISSLLGSYTYDDQNRMVGFSNTGTTASYGYNGKGERVRKTVNGTITRFRFGPSGALLGEYDQSGQAIREYLYMEGQPVVQLQGPVPAQVSYLHTDHLGAVLKATDGAGSVVWDSDRRPFGERVETVAQVEMLLGFPGQYYDQESNNYYNYFRDYDPTTGRYLQSDPIGLNGGNNLYVYVMSSPINNFDPLGLKCCTIRVVTDMECVIRANDKFRKCLHNMFMECNSLTGEGGFIPFGASVIMCSSPPAHDRWRINCNEQLQRDLLKCKIEVCYFR
ncbi:MAG: RHS domain-containing protein [Candidatus Thiodiazotropha lotti]|uniref:RHS domain-containing protein n=1 Tax=Candidatus Thiodiazotropha lotti TaxID=2792787 RepID=A0A9E4KAF7_9GAMM|nr:RHS domain-containing protein [Candidatus Thiodiazotropha lotti]MCW4205938.1 RHS domain-containing protein [Candidatus Thiodiazotropha lotti]